MAVAARVFSDDREDVVVLTRVADAVAVLKLLVRAGLRVHADAVLRQAPDVVHLWDRLVAVMQLLLATSSMAVP